MILSDRVDSKLEMVWKIAVAASFKIDINISASYWGN
jgi:hypothetical protein